VTITGNTIGNIREKDSIKSGTQVGIGVLVGGDTGGVITAGSATVSNNTITGYQKGGIVVENSGSSGTVSNNTVRGAGKTNALAENGIEVGFGATATVSNNSVSKNIYGLASTTGYEAADILLYQPGTGTTVSNNNLTQCDVGIWALDAASGTISNNNVSGFDFEGIDLDIVSTGCSKMVVSNNSVSNSNGAADGIIMFNATSCTISNNSVSNVGENGLWLAGGDTSNTISNNAVTNSAVDGFLVADYNGAQPNGVGTTSTSSGNTFSNNSGTGSGTWDALDVSKGSGTAGTANTWKGNAFKKKNPGGLT
jgi:parallel beta-helix repeat protein